ncbi:anti-sigma factor domain-containing protein [Naasia sp. SYSU D00948]|uniref:anti-sigma factor domain-containing protein n=1 Tax=Naasia sp. SYSU D00948 TaxID=2817379 RepID=UPI001B3014AF|nr:anti-sigma factor [Naasia sp. SYSU D00948]
MSDCYDRASSSGAYALGALSPEDAAEFEAAVRDSAQLRAEVDGFAEAAAVLALAVPPVAPSPALKASILAAIDAEPQRAEPAPVAGAEPAAAEPAGADVLPDAGPAVTGPAAAEPLVAAAAASEVADSEPRLAGGQHVARRPSRGRPTAKALRALAGAAAAVVLFAGGALAGGLLTAVSQERTADRFAALNAAPDAVRTNTPLPDGGSISFVGSEELGMSAVVLHDAELPEGSTFQAWYVEESGPESAGIVDPDAGPNYRMLEGDYDGEPVAMTIEPEGGSAEPTTEPMVLTEGA